jgi:hypothetical protein
MSEQEFDKSGYEVAFKKTVDEQNEEFEKLRKQKLTTRFTAAAAVIANAVLTLKSHITEEHKDRAVKWLYDLK